MNWCTLLKGNKQGIPTNQDVEEFRAARFGQFAIKQDGAVRNLFQPNRHKDMAGAQSGFGDAQAGQGIDEPASAKYSSLTNADAGWLFDSRRRSHRACEPASGIPDH
jgi:hypothetical protein